MKKMHWAEIMDKKEQESTSECVQKEKLNAHSRA